MKTVRHGGVSAVGGNQNPPAARVVLKAVERALDATSDKLPSRHLPLTQNLIPLSGDRFEKSLRAGMLPRATMKSPRLSPSVSKLTVCPGIVFEVVSHLVPLLRGRQSQFRSLFPRRSLQSRNHENRLPQGVNLLARRCICELFRGLLVHGSRSPLICIHDRAG